MKSEMQYIVVPFRLTKGKFSPGESRKASSEAKALEIAQRTATRFAGASAIAVEIDEDGEAHEPRLIGAFGNTPPLELGV